MDPKMATHKKWDGRASQAKVDHATKSLPAPNSFMEIQQGVCDEGKAALSAQFPVLIS